ncbi:hypothetical protein ATANTOWER_021643, partial [Ataeniobius toweri]|nr:hypothetical protein [Ataeniobius toweri]
FEKRFLTLPLVVFCRTSTIVSINLLNLIYCVWLKFRVLCTTCYISLTLLGKVVLAAARAVVGHDRHHGCNVND